MTPNGAVTVLLVEDNAIDVLALKRAFEAHRIANPITVASDGLEALEILRGEGCEDRLRQPYVVVLDLNMPRMGGLEFLEEVRSDPCLRRAIIIVLTTSEDESDVLAAYDKQIAAYLSKHDAGSDFAHLIELFELFQVCVHFPPD